MSEVLNGMGWVAAWFVFVGGALAVILAWGQFTIEAFNYSGGLERVAWLVAITLLANVFLVPMLWGISFLASV